jgi:hypothetical protein
MVSLAVAPLLVVQVRPGLVALAYGVVLGSANAPPTRVFTPPP